MRNAVLAISMSYEDSGISTELGCDGEGGIARGFVLLYVCGRRRDRVKSCEIWERNIQNLGWKTLTGLLVRSLTSVLLLNSLS